ncbi:MAG: Asp-tRNA(Asn)/Glu-tRNA(Gln) amidotransferase subunit GatA [Clostridia bacterium]|nr:Asp-tRNA(Asn)/Glu-tRNA(Gln) amidotransferase subunit GatA [Clostridia bacterium]
MDVLKMTALEIASAIKQGKITSHEVVSAFFEEIERKNGEINAFITLCKEQALKKAAEVQKKIESGELTSALAGVPIGIKDNICTKGIKTTCASKMLENFVPQYNASVVEKLEAAGMIVIGKLNMDEFAMGNSSETSFFGAVKNPWDLKRSAGGSSGGSAAAVAAGLCPIALGSDTGGSIRQPASFCSVTGFKSTYGTVSRYGLVAYASSLDQIGPIAMDVADANALFDIISGRDNRDSTSLDINSQTPLLPSKDIRDMKIGVPAECFKVSGVEDEVLSSVRAAAERFKELGTEVEEISLPFVDYAVAAYYIIACAEASSNLSRFDGVKYGYRTENADNLAELYSKTRSEGFGNEVKKRILLGTFVLSSGYFDAYYRKALKVKAVITKKFDEVFEKYDLILTPVVPTVAPMLDKEEKNRLEAYLSDIFTVSSNIAGLPSLSIPCGFSKSGLPIGVQLIGNRLSDKLVLNTGFAYQMATDFHKKKAEVK